MHLFRDLRPLGWRTGAGWLRRPWPREPVAGTVGRSSWGDNAGHGGPFTLVGLSSCLAAVHCVLQCHRIIRKGFFKSTCSLKM